MSLYVGVNGSTKKVSKLLVGVNGAAKEVNTGYTGVNSNLNKVYEGFNKDIEFTKVNPVKLLTSGKITSEDIGKTVYLSNSTTDVQEWRIIDINHDGTSGTVDLISKYVLCEGSGDDYWNMTNGYAASDYSFGETTYSPANCGYYGDIYKKTYEKGHVRQWINGTFLQGFNANIQNSLKTMAVQIPQYDFLEYGNVFYDSYYLYDKVKIPSAAELGVSSSLIKLGSRSSTDSDKYAAGNAYPSLLGTNGYISMSSHIDPRREYKYSVRDHHITYDRTSTDSGIRYNIKALLLYYTNYNNGREGFIDFSGYDVALLTPIIRF